MKSIKNNGNETMGTKTQPSRFRIPKNSDKIRIITKKKQMVDEISHVFKYSFTHPKIERKILISCLINSSDIVTSSQSR